MFNLVGDLILVHMGWAHIVEGSKPFIVSSLAWMDHSPEHGTQVIGQCNLSFYWIKERKDGQLDCLHLGDLFACREKES